MSKRLNGYISTCVAVRKSKASRRHVRYLEDRLEFFVEGSGTVMQAYDEDEDYYYIPRGVLLDPLFPELPNVSDQRVTREAAIPDPVIKLRPDQRMPAKKLRRAGGGVLHAPTGSGKTVVGLYTAGMMKQRTLVLVHTKDLMYQWVERAKFVLGMSEHDIGIIGDGQWEERDLTIAMIQTLARYDFNKTDFMHQWGMVIQDECHRCPAEMFAKVVQASPARYLFGLTATPTRNDGMHPLMHAIIGPIVATMKEQKLVDSGKLILPTVYMKETGFRSSTGHALRRARNQYARNKLYQNLVKELVEDEGRNEMIRDLVLKHKDESVLVLSERVAHLHTLHDMVMEADWQINCHVITGSTKSAKREDILNEMREGKANVLFATQLADEGLDLPRLNVLILTFPGKAAERLTQRIGRIMRASDGKKRARVYDLVDSHIQVFVNHATRRRNVYRKAKKMKVKGWNPNKLD